MPLSGKKDFPSNSKSTAENSCAFFIDKIRHSISCAIGSSLYIHELKRRLIDLNLDQNHMKAAFNNKYGLPDVIDIIDTPKPEHKPNEILIKIHAATVNRTDTGFLTGKPLFVRLFIGLLRPKYKVLGCEFAGTIESIGQEVKRFKKGDKVFGFNEWKFASHAEYTTIEENGTVALMPDSFSFEQAAPLSEGAFYAWFNLRAAKVSKGQRILINGATGAIGSAAVQISKYLGLHVTAVCNTKNLELIQLLGADLVIDYTRQDFTQLSDKFDLIFDAVGKSSFSACKPLLKEKGIYVSTELGVGSQNPFLALLTPIFGGKKVLFPLPSLKSEDVQFFREMAQAGKYKPVIDRVYPFKDIREAYTYVLTGQKTGNVVIKIIENSLSNT